MLLDKNKTLIIQIEVVKMKDLLSRLKTANQNDGLNTTFERGQTS